MVVGWPFYATGRNRGWKVPEGGGSTLSGSTSTITIETATTIGMGLSNSANRAAGGSKVGEESTFCGMLENF